MEVSVETVDVEIYFIYPSISIMYQFCHSSQCANVGLDLTGQEAEEVRGSLAALAVSALQEEAQKQAAFVRQSMLKRFDQLFRNDESGLPRKWQDEKNIRQIFLKARDEVCRSIFASDCFRGFQ